MSAVAEPAGNGGEARAGAPPRALSPGARSWRRFKANRRGYASLWIFGVLFVLSLFADVLSNDRPLLLSYRGQIYSPLFHDYPETTFGGDFHTNTDYLDPYIRDQIEHNGWVLYAPNRYRFDTIDYFAERPNPAPPSARNLVGTDDRGRDVLARLIYGFRVSVLFGFALTAIGVVVGVLAGAVQGYFGGRVDLYFQRFIEVWGSMPELYLLIIFAAIFRPSIGLLLILLSLFGWMGLADYVRAEFLRSRNLDYVKAARALGLDNRSIIWRHLIPNSMMPVVTFLPFRVSGAILGLTSLDFLGLGVPPSTPSLGELLAQGKDNLDAWWISLSTFVVLVGTLVLLIFIGEALREALDPRRG
jgi:microcin C transport system permease protein